jgi:uncharacterized membrane protein
VKSQSGDDPKELDRIIFFSDAVFAIVMTLLVLDIPDTRGTTGFGNSRIAGSCIQLMAQVSKLRAQLHSNRYLLDSASRYLSVFQEP